MSYPIPAGVARARSRTTRSTLTINLSGEEIRRLRVYADRFTDGDLDRAAEDVVRVSIRTWME